MQRCFLLFFSMPTTEYISGALLRVKFATNFRVTFLNQLINETRHLAVQNSRHVWKNNGNLL